MRLLHTGDWHLGRLFHGVYLTEEQAFVLDQMVDVIRQTRPDVVLVAGDIYDRAVPPPDAVSLLDDFLSRVVLGLKVPVVLIAGNHDSPDRLGFGSRLLAEQGLHLFTSIEDELRPLALRDEHGVVEIYCLPYLEPPQVRQTLEQHSIGDHDAATRALLQRIHPMRLNNRRCILVAHLTLQGASRSESERPLSLRDSATVSLTSLDGFRYAALGHLHRPQAVGRASVRYCGSLLKYSFSETNDHKSVSLVDIDQEGKTWVETIALRPKHDVRCVDGTMQQLLTAEVTEAARHDYLKVSLLDEGPVLDVMGRLRERYPNVLQVERPTLALRAHEQHLGDHRTLSEQQLFAAFHEQVTGAELNQQESDVLSAVIADLRHGQRESPGRPRSVEVLPFAKRDSGRDRAQEGHACGH